MKHITKTLFIFIIFFCGIGFAQNKVLTKDEAIIKTLENNYGIKRSRNLIDIADNNQSLLNSGYLPSLSANAGTNYNIENIQAQLRGGESQNLTGAETKRYNASLNLNYTLFDGLGRLYNYKQLKEQYKLTELEARETIENTILQLLSVYFEVARLTENVSVLNETLEISKQRITRAQYQFDYGQTSRLGILNAEVDVNNDSIALLNTQQQLENTKRDLLVILNEPEKELQSVAIDTTINFLSEIELEEFIKTSNLNNVSLLQAESNLLISDYDIKVSKSGYLPTLGLTGSYGWNNSNLPSTSFVQTNTSTGYSAGLNLNWNLFDGGSTITNIKNAQIRLENQQYLKEQLILEVQRDIANSWGNYQNKKYIYKVQEKNVLTNEDNFNRSQEQFKLGQISSIEFRQAQINLLNAQTNKNLAKYDAKFAELQVLQLTGQLLNLEF
ncbi:outer membrane protein TolC [Gillisia sp. Hel_I_86]|uniref:TolC family protein n=1 Tax=Gillisia sp. Hel_I_86 TaxID=1249981 RepID=UPI00119A0907|nr:TolC family protein [Gillisia sp. Hel_I_86]TVZ27052.1 outer membrane protein TolC [Gillisia sp. Hel_I_86]